MPRIVFRFRIIFLLNFLLLVHTSAQSPFFKTIALLKNHQPISANAIFQDSKGYLWIAGSMGLIRYDGIESYTFDKDDSIGASPVTAISEDSLARIWIGHKNGSIEYYSDNYFKKFKPEEGLGHSEVSFIKFDSQSVLWFGTLGEGVYYFSGKNRKRLYNINQDEGLNDNYVYAMVESSDNIYIGTDNGIGVLNKNTHKVQTTISMKNGLPDNLVKHLEINGNTLWIGTDDKGICTLDLKTQTFSFIKEWTFGTLNTFTLKTPDDCWISTKNDGVVRIKLENSTLKFTSRYTSLNGLPGNTTQTIFTDREKNIWISCNKELVLGASSAFEFIDQKSEGFEYGSVFSFIMDTKGRYWAATQKGLLCAESDSRGRLKFEKVLQEIKEIQNASISLYQDSKGYIWAGTYGYGVYRIDPETRKYMKFDIKNGLPDNNVLYITGSKNLVWLATAGGGAAVYNIDKQSFATYNINNGLGSNYLYSIFADSKGNTWFALDGKGVSVLKDGILTKHFIPDSLGVNSVYAITEDKFNGLWFLTSDKGILRCHAGKFSFFDETNVLKSNNIRSLIADKSGNIIMAGNEGIQVYLCQLGGFVSFGEERGLSYLEPNLNGVSCDTSGTVWISESTGIIKYSPLQVSQQKVKPNINIDKKLLFFNTFKAGKTHFSYNQNHFTFQYTGLWFQSAEKLNYRYKLENYDYDWSIPSHMRLVTYSRTVPIRISSKSSILQTTIPVT